MHKSHFSWERLVRHQLLVPTAFPLINGVVMNRSSKATLAGGLAVVLLAGGATTFARWYSEQEVGVAEVRSGELKLVTVPESDEWTINGDNGYVATTLIVPGDVVTYSTDVTTTIRGQNLEATLEADFKGEAPEGLIVEVLVKDEHNETVNTLTPDHDGDIFTAEVTIEFPEYEGDVEGAMWKQQLQDTKFEMQDLVLKLEQNERS